jgi:hypothetical protein
VKVPPELFAEWRNDAAGTRWMDSRTIAAKLVDRAAQWGYDLREPELQQAADQELEACCEYLQSEIGPLEAAHFRAAMRPKPPTLAEQGMKALNKGCFPSDDEIATIRTALNRLAELEAQQ